MSFNLTTEFIDESFQQLTQISGSQLVDGTGSLITNLDITSSNAVSALTASLLLGSVQSASFASTATSASHAIIADSSLTATSSSYATFAEGAGEVQFSDVTGKPSLVSSSAQIELVDTVGDLSGSRIVGLVPSASYAISASHEIIKEVSSSYADFAQQAGTAATATVANTANNVQYVNVTGKPTLVSGSSQIDLNQTTGNIAATRVIGTVSNALTASIATTSDTSTSSSYSDFALNAGNAGFATQAAEALEVDFVNIVNKPALVSSSAQIDISNTTGNITSSRIDGEITSAVSSSYSDFALTASYAANVSAPEWNTILNKPNGIVSSSIQVSINGTTGDLSGSRVVGTVASALSASHAETSDLAALATQATDAIYSQNTVVTGKNVSGAPIPKGTPLYFTGSNTQGNLVGVWPADASNPARMPAGGIAAEELADGAEGYVLLDGYIGEVDTSLFNSGDSVYVAPGGGYTNSKPTGAGNQVQFLGNVEKAAVNGSGVITMMGEAHSLPNIEQGRIWVGGANDVPYTLSTGSFAKTNISNTFSADQTFDNIFVNGTGSFAYIQSVTGSAKVIGDAFLILNTDSPTERYAGIKVYDSGSTPISTASLQFDSQTNDWFYSYNNDDTDYGVVLFGPEYGTLGTPIYNTKNRIVKSDGKHHINDSNISDDGVRVDILTNTYVTGSVQASAGFTGDLTGNVFGNAATATSASNVAFGNVYDKPTLVSSSAQIDLSQATGTAGAALVASEVVVASEAGNATFYIPFVDTLSGTDFNRVDPGITYNPFTNALDVSGTITSTFSGNLTGDVVGNASTATTATTANSASSVHWLGVYAKPQGLVSQSAQVDIEQTTNYSTLQTNISGSISALSSSAAAALTTLDSEVVKLAGTQTITGDKTFSGTVDFDDQVTGQVNALSISSNTASLDCSTGNFFTLTLQNGIDTLLEITNITPGQTINLKVTNNATSAGTLSFGSNIKFPGGTAPTITEETSAEDIITFVSFDGSNINGTSVLNLSIPA